MRAGEPRRQALGDGLDSALAFRGLDLLPTLLDRSRIARVRVAEDGRVYGKTSPPPLSF